ncbi:MAG: hypothetical protein RMJ28_02710 [Nitrososphaerota archaeon]|nr:hypothetical protein [Candidatus Calditenuaceae archaeon]MDW8073134.1 hypothetical protein [Nitrososphaerota archaeon]
MVLAELRRRLRTIFAVTETSDVARRYFSLQVFDGAMVGIGIIFGLHLSGPHTLGVVLQATLSIALAVFISGWTGALISERAEQAARIRRLELATLRELRNTLLGRVGSIAVLLVALVNGLTPVAAVLAVSFPYLATLHLGLERSLGLIGTVTVSTLLLLTAGAVVGRSTGIGVLRTSSQMIGAGLAAAVLVILLESFF